MSEDQRVRATDARPRRQWLLPTLQRYDRSWLGKDVLAGLSAGAVVIPQAMAYATIANLPVQTGLYTCIAPMIAYVLVGGSRAMSVSTTSTIATLTATTLVSAGVAAVPGAVPADLITLTLLVGLVLLVARVFRLGSLVENINPATIAGLQVGVSATVAAGQLPKLLGEDTDFTGHGFIRSVIATIEAIPAANLATVILSAVSIAVLYSAKKLAPRVPAQLVVVVITIIISATGLLSSAGVDLITPVPQGFPPFQLPSLAHVGGLMPGALAISMMAFLESSAVARGIRKREDPPIDSNRELLATSVVNIAGSAFQTLPAAGGFSQSAVNQGAGARSQVSGAVTAVLAVLVVLFLGPVLNPLPQATLAAMVFVAVAGLIDLKALARYWRISRPEFWLAVITGLIGMSVGLLPAVAVGVLLTLGLLLHELNKPRIDVSQPVNKVLPVKLLSPLYTANILVTRNAVTAALHEHPQVEAVALEVSVQQVVSLTVLDSLAELDNDLAAEGVQLRLVAVAPDTADRARLTSWYQGLVAQHRVFDTVADALTSPLTH